MKKDTKYLISAIPVLAMFHVAFVLPALAAIGALCWWAWGYSPITNIAVVMLATMVAVAIYYKGIVWLRERRHHGSS